MNSNIVALTYDAPTRVEGTSVLLLEPTQPVLLSGGKFPRHRKQIAISNPATANSIYVYTKVGGSIVQEIFPRTTWTFFTNGDLWIAPSGAANFSAYVLQTFYE